MMLVRTLFLLIGFADGSVSYFNVDLWLATGRRRGSTVSRRAT